MNYIVEASKIIIDQIKHAFSEKPNAFLFSLDTSVFKNPDEVQVFIDEWNKEMPYRVHVTPFDDWSFCRVSGDRRLLN